MPETPSYLLLALPEILSLVGLLAAVVAGVREGRRENGNASEGNDFPRDRWLYVFGFLLFCAVVAILPVQHGLLNSAQPFSSFRFFPLNSDTQQSGLLIVDAPAILFKGGIALAALAALIAGLFGRLSERVRSSPRFLTGLFGTVFGAFLLAGANDLLIAWGGIELLVLAARVAGGEERSAGKFYRFGFFFSALSLFGLLLFYGMFGTTEVFAIAQTISARNVETVPANGLLIASLFLFIGFLVRIGTGLAEIVWGGRVASLPFLSLFSLIAAAGYALLSRLIVGVFPPDIQGMEIGTLVIVFGGVIGIACGLLAVGADNLYRSLCYAAGAHLGVALLPLASRSTFGFTSGTVYLAIHLGLTLAVVAGIGRMKGTEGGMIEELRGTFSPKRGGDLFTGILLLALAGFPFTGGFLSRFFLLDSLLESEESLLLSLLCGVAVSILLLYAYGRTLHALYFPALQNSDRRSARKKGDYPATIKERLVDVVPGIVGALAIVIGFPGGFRVLWNLFRSWLSGGG